MTLQMLNGLGYCCVVLSMQFFDHVAPCRRVGFGSCVCVCVCVCVLVPVRSETHMQTLLDRAEALERMLRQARFLLEVVLLQPLH